MAKRFTDSEKWKDDWFSELRIESKLLWLFMLDTCDHAGIWKDQLKYFNYINGTELTLSNIKDDFSDRVMEIRPSVFFIPKFISFQYPNFNPDKNNAHKGVLKSLLYNGASEGLIEGLVCNHLNFGRNLGAKEGLGRVTGIGIGIGLGIGIGIGKGKEGLIENNAEYINFDNMSDKELEDCRNAFMKGIP